jgi:para-nitrobenzyl esterase
MNSTTGAAVIAVLLFIGGSAMAANLQIEAGSLRGAEQAGIYSFKGIPYAEPPVGERRWRAPARQRGWQGERDATRFGAACPQFPFPEGSPYHHELPAVSEDCLFLNVWTPSLDPARALPVMVWIHGGGFTRGAGSVPSYDGSVLAAEGVVLVSINYRLNIFGYLAHPALSREQGGASGNYGLQDQVAALRWVRDNVADFGGDPGNVTIFGESAGATAVNQLLFVPSAAGLFHRAIGQSGGYLSPQPTLDAAHATGEAVAARLGTSDPAVMRGLPTGQVMAAFQAAEASGDERIRPAVDGRVIPAAPLGLLKSGRFNRVPSLVGYNRDESTVFALADSVPFLYRDQVAFESGLKDFLGLMAYPFFWLYPEQAGSQQPYLDFWRDLIFGWNVQAWARFSEAAGEPAWMYFFTRVPPTPTGERLGAYHAAEIAYVFGNGLTDTPEDRALSAALRGYWVNFARRGDPNGPDLPDWPRFGEARVYLELGDAIRVGEELDWSRMRLWDLVYDRDEDE